MRDIECILNLTRAFIGSLKPFRAILVDHLTTIGLAQEYDNEGKKESSIDLVSR